MRCRISVIIPNRNGAKTIGLCLDALCRSVHDAFEIIVVDDCSSDASVSIIRGFPCRLIRLEQHLGTAAARNTGARHSRGDLLFFIDADCLVKKDTLLRAEKMAAEWGPESVIGGTYTCLPHDQTFYSVFQSVFIHFFEVKKGADCDYIAGHAMVISRETFRRSRGFAHNFLPLIEDVEFSHRLREMGYRLVMDQELQVRHVFQYRFLRDSLHNGYRKSEYWTMYSLGNKDLLADSGTASHELKCTVLALVAILILMVGDLYAPGVVAKFLLVATVIVITFLNRGLFALFYRTGGPFFALRASLYYMLLYPFAVAAGALTGMLRYMLSSHGIVPGIRREDKI
ncbi:MAG: glycosyltransferase [Desulfobulbaceae bacterium]|nr:glycosyltransferase [Desulfobulbaceae bacterium]